MNTQLAFAFGMLTMTAIILMIILVVGMVKVYRLEKQKKEMKADIHNRLDDIEKKIDRTITEFNRKIHHETTSIVSVFDSRLDKLQNKLNNTK